MIRLAQHHLDAGQHNQASQWADRAIQVDPLRETSHCLAIEALAMSGDRAAALAKFSALKSLLETELGVAPTDLTIALGAKLDSGEYSIPATRPAKTTVRVSELDKLFNGRAAVAVLPFSCLSKAEDDVFFADGITEDVVNGLAAWRWFPVIGRYSTNHYRDVDKAMFNVAHETGARYVIDGSIRRSGSNMRVTVELCDAATGQQLWSQRLDGKTDDVFKLQDKISDEIARRVEPEISRAESTRLYRQKASKLSLWEILHKARVTKFQNGHAYGSKDDNIAAMTMYRAALELDPGSSDAASGLATCHWHDAVNSWSTDPAASGASAKRRANEAFALDSANYSALATVSIIQTFGEHDIPAAEVTARKSLDMNPSDILTRHYLVCSLEFGGKFDEAVEQCKYMMELDPRAPSLSVLCGDLSTCLLLSGKAVEAIEYSRKSMMADPNYSRARQRLIAALVAAGEMTEAKHKYAILHKAMPAFSLDYVKRTYPFVNERHINAYLKFFKEIGVQ
jgi:TolB-like protein/Tfp pilus assembly protein PilF